MALTSVELFFYSINDVQHISKLQSPFFRLPAELRDQIYEYTFGNTSTLLRFGEKLLSTRVCMRHMNTDIVIKFLR